MVPSSSTSFVKLGRGASVVGAILVVLWAILQFGVKSAHVDGLGILLVLGLALFIGGFVGGMTVTSRVE
jgi:hypothetical protein